MEERTPESKNHLILERILSIKKSLQKGAQGPVDLHELGICYYHIDNKEQALYYLKQLTKEFPDYIEIGSVRALHALCCIEEGFYSAAETLLEECIQIDQTDTRLLSMLAYVYEKKGKTDKAIEILKRSLHIDSENTNSLNSLGYLLSLHSSQAETRKEALGYLQKTIKKNPSHPAYLDSLGVYYALEGDMERARKHLGKALEQAPDNNEIIEHIRHYLLQLPRNISK